MRNLLMQNVGHLFAYDTTKAVTLVLTTYEISEY